MISPNAEWSGRKGKGPALPNQGADIEVKIVDLRPEERRMTLSLRSQPVMEEMAPTPPQPSSRKDRRDVEDFEGRQSDREEPRFTIGDALRAKEEAAAEEDEEEGEVEG